jgi:hypothetical protein
VPAVFVFLYDIILQANQQKTINGERLAARLKIQRAVLSVTPLFIRVDDRADVLAFERRRDAIRMQAVDDLK